MSNITSCDSGSFSTDNNTNTREGDASLLLLNNNNNNNNNNNKQQQSESEILGGGGGNFHSPNSNSSTITNTNSSSNASNANSQPQPPQPPPKKKRSLPGNPDPSAEVIALSPNTLVTTNRFICEICNKGFQRDQNLQLHRRGHNLPWKLKQRSSSEVRKRVYVCPEPSCVHHNPSRALGDLTGIKKHFSRKHGDKKWKCDKCNKKYAVHSDWKAHSKICGTKEYKCDCGTVFSRRDSFITHRAFCDALADENNKVNTEGGGIGHFPKIGSNLLQPLIPNLVASLPAITRNNNNNSNSNPQIIAASEFKQQHPSSFPHELMPMPMPEQKPFINNNNIINPLSLPSLQLNSPHSSLTMFDDENNGGVHLAAGLPHMSATALLQKAAQMGATTVSNTSMAPPSFASSTNNGIIMEHFMHNAQHDNNNNSFSVVNNNGSVGMNGVEMFNAILDQSKALAKIIDQNNRSSGFSIPPVMSGRSISSTINIGGAKGNEDVMTLDFLGIGGGGGVVSGGGDGGPHGYFGIGPLA